MRHGKVTVAQGLIVLGSKRRYIGVAPYPVPPLGGDVWEELDASGNWIEVWYWNGLFWLSQQTYEKYQATSALSGVAPNFHYPLPTASYDLFLTSLYATILVNVAATATDNWQWSIKTVNATSGATNILTANNIGQAANTWQNFKTALSGRQPFLSPSKVAFQLAETRVGTTITRQGIVGFEYKKCRP